MHVRNKSQTGSKPPLEVVLVEQVQSGLMVSAVQCNWLDPDLIVRCGQAFRVQYIFCGVGERN